MNRRRLLQGFTMVEMVITIVILGIIAGIGAILLASGVDAYLAGQRVMANAPSARLAMDRTLLELSQACEGGLSVSDTQVILSAPDPECQTSPAEHAIRIRGSDLQLRVTPVPPSGEATWYPLARNVDRIDGGPVFSLSSDSVSGCQYLTIQFSVTNSSGDSLPIRSAVVLRNQPCLPPPAT